MSGRLGIRRVITRISLFCQKRELTPTEITGILVYEPLGRFRVWGDDSGGEAFAMQACFDAQNLCRGWEACYGMHLESPHSYSEMGHGDRSMAGSPQASSVYSNILGDKDLVPNKVEGVG